MERSFWQARWDSGRTAFHLPTVNRYLAQFGARLEGGVLVPFAGKSVDLTWLVERGHEVVAVEFVEAAVLAYFEERGIASERVRDTVLRGGGVEAHVVDLFALTPEDVGPLGAWYDRGAMVSLPPAERERYVTHIMRFLPAGAKGLVVTLDYGAKTDRPPFPMPPAEVRDLFAPHGELEELVTEEVLHENEHFRARGTDWLHETAWSFVRA